MPDSNPRTRKSKALAALALVVVLVAFPVGAWASHQYLDVPDSNPFHGDITAVTNAGVTSGCGGGNFCPDRDVTRAEMAAFMNRLGALASNKTPVVNATTVDRFDANSISRIAYSNDDDVVDGTSGTLLSVAITAPTRGWYNIVASVDSSNFGTSDSFNCQLNLDGTFIAGSLRFVGLIDNANEEQDCSTNAGASTCGGASTITLSASGVAATTTFDDGALQVVFTPFSGAGSLPSILGCLIILPLSPSDGKSVD